MNLPLLAFSSFPDCKRRTSDHPNQPHHQGHRGASQEAVNLLSTRFYRSMKFFIRYLVYHPISRSCSQHTSVMAVYDTAGKI